VSFAALQHWTASTTNHARNAGALFWPLALQ
jgi:hypothetical protein